MLTNAYNVHTLEKMLLQFGYTKSYSSDRIKTFSHPVFQSVTLNTSGSYMEKQVKEVMMRKMGISSFQKFKDLYDQCR